jgi:exonuclease III
MAFATAREQLIQIMTYHDIDILDIQETRVNYTGKQTKGEFDIYYSSDVQDVHRINKKALQQANGTLIFDKDYVPKEQEGTTMREALEKAGTAVIINTKRVQREDFAVKQTDARLMTTTIQTKPLPMIIHNTYAPQAHAPIYKQKRVLATTRTGHGRRPGARSEIFVGRHECKTITPTTS